MLDRKCKKALNWYIYIYIYINLQFICESTCTIPIEFDSKKLIFKHFWTRPPLFQTVVLTWFTLSSINWCHWWPPSYPHSRGKALAASAVLRPMGWAERHGTQGHKGKHHHASPWRSGCSQGMAGGEHGCSYRLGCVATFCCWDFVLLAPILQRNYCFIGSVGGQSAHLQGWGWYPTWGPPAWENRSGWEAPQCYPKKLHQHVLSS